ncbi:MAG TPA: tyrosine-type recombinase/integrase [Candidatus Dormibacteraeota bacterium]|nr:tyrosine-type recombinase/integrase [Candidatus Dormibacteraeota bacterium]
MRKTATKLTKVRVNGRRFYCVTWPKIGKGRNRRFFKDKSEAETVLDQKLIEQENYGTAGMAFTESQRSEYLESCEILSQFGVTIRDAVKFYLPHLQAANRSCTVAELAKERLAVKTADGASGRYLADLRSRLGQFAAIFGTKPVAEITATEVDNWLRSLSDSTTGRCRSPTTRNNFRRVLVSTFNFARTRGYCVENPAAKSAKAKQIDSPVGILSVEELARLLENAPSDLISYVAIGAFTGLRSAELERLDWKEIDLQSGLIEVTASKAKSARRRFVKIQPNLARWLQPHAQLSGNVTPPGYRMLLESAREQAGITEWPQNALRHSFASYHLARFNDAALLALELGHTNSNLVFQHYRQLVKPKQAERYWKIAPSSGGRQIVAFAP